MAGITATTAVWDALLQEDYVQVEIVEAINTATPFKDKLKRVGMTSGRERLYPVKVGASQAAGARGEGAAMPPYGAGQYKDATVKAKFNYAPFKVTGQSLEFGTKKAFVEFGLQILKDTKESLKLFTGRQCWGDGQGTLALINNGGGYAAGQGTAATPLTVDAAYGVAWGCLSTLTTFLLKPNMVIQFGTEDNSGQGYTVQTVTSTQITISPPLANAIADDVAVSVLGSANKEITGALVFAATASFMTSVLNLATAIYNGIDRAANPAWEGNVVNANAVALSLTLIRNTRDAIYKRTDDEESNLMIGGTEAARDYEALLISAQRFVPPSKLEGGHTILEHDGLRFSKDSKAPIEALFFFDTNMIQWAQTKDPHWLQDGNGIMRVVPGQDALEGLLKWYAELDVPEPRRQAILYNLAMS